MSIKICVITPTSHLQTYASLGEMDMSLAHLILEEPEGLYAKYYKEQSKEGRFVILDNGLFELEAQGIGAVVDSVLDAAEITNPSEVIATDVLFNGVRTIESTENFIKRMKERDLLGNYRVMAVPQGSCEVEWWDCFCYLARMPEVDTIGLSKLSVPVSFLGEKHSSGNCAIARLKCTQRIANEYIHDLPRGVHMPTVHLLGGDNWTAWEMTQQVQYDWIRSNDSSCAVWYGASGHVFDEEGMIDNIILEKPDLENTKQDTSSTLDWGCSYILENIVRWHMACKG